MNMRTEKKKKKKKRAIDRALYLWGRTSKIGVWTRVEALLIKPVASTAAHSTGKQV